MYKLLLVDDEPIICEGIRQMIDWNAMQLELLGPCHNAFSALDVMTECMPDILLTDVRMPGMNGLELAERALALNPQLQIIILSGYDEFDYVRQAMKTGAIEYLLKPCNRQETEAALQAACHAIDRLRLKVTHLYDERQARIAELNQQLNELMFSTHDPAQLRARVEELAAAQVDPSILREALIAIVTSAQGENTWRMTVIANAVRAQQTLPELVAETLLKIRAGAGGANDFVRQMAVYAEKHYGDERLSLQFLADNVIHMNADYIGREFSRSMGKKFSMYLLEVRMERAKLLMLSDATLHSYEVAEQIGLGNNPHYFGQVFRKYTGMTTKEYRQKNS